jgi:hypothetical protein
MAMSVPVPGIMRNSWVRDAATPCRAAAPRPVSPTFRSSVFSTSGGDLPAPSSTRLRVLPANVNRFLSEDSVNENGDNRGRRHYSPQVSREAPLFHNRRKASPHSRDRNCSPLSPRGGSPQRCSTPGTPPNGSSVNISHLSSAGVEACTKPSEQSALRMAVARSETPQQMSPRVRAILQDEPLHADEPLQAFTSRRRSPLRTKDQASCFSEEHGAGIPSVRKPVAAVDRQGWGSMTAAKEAQMDEDRIQLRSGNTPRAPHEAPLADLSSSELRCMGIAVRESNSRLREHLTLAAKEQSSRSSLKRQKAGGPRLGPKSEVRTQSPKPGASAVIPTSPRSTTPRTGNPLHLQSAERWSGPRCIERSVTAPRSTRQLAASSARVEVATVQTNHRSNDALPHFGRLRRDMIVESKKEILENGCAAVSVAPAKTSARHEVQRLPTAPPCWPPSVASSTSPAPDLHIRTSAASSKRTPTPTGALAPACDMDVVTSGALSSDISFSSLGEAVFAWAPPDAFDAPCEAPFDYVCTAQVDDAPISMVVLESPLDSSSLANPRVEHLTAMKLRLDSLMRKATRDVEGSPKPRTSLGGA